MLSRHHGNSAPCYAISLCFDCTGFWWFWISMVGGLCVSPALSPLLWNFGSLEMGWAQMTELKAQISTNEWHNLDFEFPKRRGRDVEHISFSFCVFYKYNTLFSLHPTVQLLSFRYDLQYNLMIYIT